MSSVARIGRHPIAWRSKDAALTMALAVLALLGSLGQLINGGVSAPASGAARLDPLGFMLVLCATIPVVVSAVAPRFVVAVTGSATVVLGVFGYPLVVPLGPAAAIFLLTSLSISFPRRELAAGMLVAFAAWLLASVFRGQLPLSEVVHSVLAGGLAWFAGERTRLRRELIDDLRERARRAERDVARDRLLATTEERLRIARDLHDSIGHAVNVIALRAGTARMRDEAERSRAALAAIEELARATAAELDHMVGTLRDRDSEPGAAPEPAGLASLESLLARQRAAGLEIHVESRGLPQPLGSSSDQAAFRIVQEALTNAARHGAGTARICLTFDTSELELWVRNPLARPEERSPARGHGLVGMHERARLAGGRIEAGRDGDAFSLRATLPYRGPAR